MFSKFDKMKNNLIYAETIHVCTTTSVSMNLHELLIPHYGLLDQIINVFFFGIARKF